MKSQSSVVRVTLRVLLVSGVLVPAVQLVGLRAAGAETPGEGLPSANELLERSIAHHDPAGRFLSEGHRLEFLETRPDGTERRSEVVIEVPGEHFEMVRGGSPEVAGMVAPGKCEMTLDGRSDLTDEERTEHRVSCDRIQMMRNYYTYLWGLPMKLRDPGTRLGRVTDTTFEGRPVYDLRVTYDEEVGKDVWYFYFDRGTSALVGYRFYHDEEKNDGEVILLEGEVKAEGMRLPKRRTWITHQDDRLLGTDTLVNLVRLWTGD